MPQKKIEKLANFVRNPELAVFSELADIQQEVEKINSIMGDVDFNELERLKGEKGDQGPEGPEGPRGVRGLTGPMGPMGYDGAQGPQGEKGEKGDKGDKGDDGKDGVEISAEQIKEKLQSLKKDKRLSADAIQGLPTVDDVISAIKTGKKLDIVDLKNGQQILYPNKKQIDQRWHGAGVTKIIAGTGIAITSTGDPAGLGDVTISSTAAAVSFVYNEVPSGSVDGSNVYFTTAFNFIANSTQLYRNGIRQFLGTDYTESGSDTVVFTQAPLTGDILIIDYSKV